jgi:hypothetical protein
VGLGRTHRWPRTLRRHSVARLFSAIPKSVKGPCVMIVTMAYDEDFANRIRRADRLRGRLHRAEDVRRNGLHDRRPLSGGGQRRGWPDDPVLQRGDEALLAKPGARPFEMRGLEMKGWLRVDAESVSTKRELEPWGMESVAFAQALPPKKK